jgi:hypothetical protein
MSSSRRLRGEHQRPEFERLTHLSTVINTIFTRITVLTIMNDYLNISERNMYFNNLIRDRDQLQDLITNNERTNRSVIRLIYNALDCANNLIVPYQNSLSRSRSNSNLSTLNSQAEITVSSSNSQTDTKNKRTRRIRRTSGGKSKPKK